MNNSIPWMLAGAGIAGISRAPLTMMDRQVRTWGLGAIGMAAMLIAGTAARADQFRMAADNAHVACVVSKSDVTRISLVGDQIAAVSKRMAGGPYNDFSIVNEPIRGDIYIAIPDTYAATSISFFATSKKGYVYQFACDIASVTAQQVFLTNPAIATSKAADWESQTPAQDTAVRLIQAMSQQATIDGYQIAQPGGSVAKVGDLAIRLIAQYRGAALLGKTLRIENRGTRAVMLREGDLAPQGTLAVTIAQPSLAPGEATTAYLVAQNEGE